MERFHDKDLDHCKCWRKDHSKWSDEIETWSCLVKCLQSDLENLSDLVEDIDKDLLIHHQEIKHHDELIDEENNYVYFKKHNRFSGEEEDLRSQAKDHTRSRLKHENLREVFNQVTQLRDLIHQTTHDFKKSQEEM